LLNAAALLRGTGDEPTGSQASIRITAWETPPSGEIRAARMAERILFLEQVGEIGHVAGTRRIP